MLMVVSFVSCSCTDISERGSQSSKSWEDGVRSGFVLSLAYISICPKCWHQSVASIEILFRRWRFFPHELFGGSRNNGVKYVIFPGLASVLGLAFNALTLLVDMGVWLLEACFSYLQKFSYGHGSHASWISFLKFPGPEKSCKISLVLESAGN